MSSEDELDARCAELESQMRSLQTDQERLRELLEDEMRTCEGTNTITIHSLSVSFFSLFLVSFIL